MAEDLMRYDLLAQDALRGVVRSALAQVARSGLPGEHHLFIALDTRHPGVRISERLRQKYPEEITIVLQHQYWNLDVGETEFSVELAFDNVLEKLVVPYTAIKGFFDPAVQFGLQFEIKPAAQGDTVEGDAAEGDAAGEPPAPEAARKAGTASAGGKDPGPAKEPAEGDARKVVSLDQFRKK
jgi:uncharacterized protein